MSTHTWTTTAERFELYVSGGDAVELLGALAKINEEATLWGTEVTWRVEGDDIVLSFQGSERSVGGWGAQNERRNLDTGR